MCILQTTVNLGLLAVRMQMKSDVNRLQQVTTRLHSVIVVFDLCIMMIWNNNFALVLYNVQVPYCIFSFETLVSIIATTKEEVLGLKVQRTHFFLKNSFLLLLEAHIVLLEAHGEAQGGNGVVFIKRPIHVVHHINKRWHIFIT